MIGRPPRSPFFRLDAALRALVRFPRATAEGFLRRTTPWLQRVAGVPVPWLRSAQMCGNLFIGHEAGDRQDVHINPVSWRVLDRNEALNHFWSGHGA